MLQYTVTGRPLPTEAVPSPTLQQMTIFAPNEIVAESRFWYFMRTYKKLKKSHGQLVAIKEVSEDDSDIKNFGI